MQNLIKNESAEANASSSSDDGSSLEVTTTPVDLSNKVIKTIYFFRLM